IDAIELISVKCPELFTGSRHIKGGISKKHRIHDGCTIPHSQHPIVIEANIETTTPFKIRTIQVQRRNDNLPPLVFNPSYAIKLCVSTAYPVIIINIHHKPVVP